MDLADEIRAVLSDPMNLPSEFLDYMLQHSAQNSVPVQSLNASTVVASGVGTSANAPTRYVGGTASGAPASGTYVAGDFVVSHDGHVYICTANGSPGTWSTWPAQGEIAYSQTSGTVVIASTNPASPTAVNAGVTAAYTGVPIYVEVFAPTVVPPNVAGGSTTLALMDGVSTVAALGVVQTPVTTALANNNLQVPLYAQVKITPSVGNHTYALSAYASSLTGPPAVSTAAGSVPIFVRTRYA